jgi:trimeric autotransporter adhesin
MPSLRHRLAFGVTLLTTGAVLAACSGADEEGTPDTDEAGANGAAPDGTASDGAAPDGAAPGPGIPSLTVGGSVEGLTGEGLVLGNGSDTVAIAKGATTFAFPSKVASGASFDVRVRTAPSGPTQTCSVSGGIGVATADVSSVKVACSVDTFPVNVTVSGLKGKSITLQNGSKPPLTVTLPATSGTFSEPLPSGGVYDVSVLTQPAAPAQFCTVTGGKGTVAAAPVSLSVTCEDRFTVGGYANVDGKGLVLQNNGGDDVTLNAGGYFTFSTPLATGDAYAVTVKTNPTDPWATCSLRNDPGDNPTGTVGSADVTSVIVVCERNSYKLQGTITGLEAPVQLVVSLGWAGAFNNAFPTFAAGTTTFEWPVTSGDAYTVGIQTQPSSPTQTCTVSNGAGKVTNANPGSVSIGCQTSSFPVKLRVLDLPAGGLVVKNGADVLSINADGTYSFPTPVKSGLPFAVSVTTPPVGGADCALYDASGTMGGASPVVTYGCKKPNKVFVTSTTYMAGALGGLPGADATCQSRATSAGLSGTFKAWLSDSTGSPSSRFSRPPYQPWVLVDGTVVAKSYAELTSGTLAHAIDKTETGGAQNFYVLTHTSTDGTIAKVGVVPRPNFGTCSNWSDTASSTFQTVGSSTSASSSWTDATGGELCDKQIALYCFGQ